MKILCAAPTCKYSSESEDSTNIIFVSFPNDDSATIWAHNCERPDLLMKTNEELHMNYYICSNHIEDCYFISKRDQIIIAQGAVPTLFRTQLQQGGNNLNSIKESYTQNNVINPLEINQCNANYVDTVTDYHNEIYNPNISNENNVIDISRNTTIDNDSLNFCDINVDHFNDLSIRHTNFCRLCGQNVINGIDILTNRGNELKLPEKIHLHLPIIIDNNDLMPQKMCSDCYDKLEISHALVINCLQTDIRLRKYLNIPKNYNHYDRFQSLITKYTLEINDEMLLENVDVTSTDKIIKNNITNDNFNIDNNTTKNCEKIQLINSKQDSRINNCILQPDLNNLLLHQLSDENFTNVLNNPVISHDNNELINDKNNDVINCLGIDSKNHVDNNDDNDFQTSCDNEQVLTLTEHRSQVPCVIFDNNDINHIKVSRENHVTTYDEKKNDNYNEKQITCEICDESFETHGNFNIHQKIHTKINSIELKRQCGHCSLPFSTRKELQNHITENHPGEILIFKCSICDKIYEKWSSLDVHEATHRQDKPYLCDLCGKSFKHSNNLRGHKRIHLDVSRKKQHICKICSGAFRSRFHLNEHMNQHNGATPYSCEECGKAFSKRIQLRQHRLSHGSNKYACPICPASFNRRGNMNSHIKRHTSSTGMYTCSVCECLYKTMSELKKHRKQHSDDDILQSIKKKNVDKPIYQCKICLRIFAKRALLVNHERSHKGEQIRVECDKCGKKLSSKNSLQYHIRSMHTSERPHMCQYCGDAFVSKEARLIHERVHTGERPYVCDFVNCNTSYRSSSNLSQHMKKHSKERPHICQYCSKDFTRKGALIIHERTHTGIKPYSCVICNKKFSQRNDMVKHGKIHNNKSLQCEKCDKIFLNKTEILKHLESNHLFESTKSLIDNDFIGLTDELDNYTMTCANIDNTVDLSSLNDS